LRRRLHAVTTFADVEGIFAEYLATMDLQGVGELELAAV
jgi:hypothetical protein